MEFDWLSEPEWQRYAMCRYFPQEWFFGGEYTEGTRRHRPTMTSIEVRRAKAICAVCPVLQDCFDHAMEHEEEYGVWGGTTRRDRKRLRGAVEPPSFFRTTSLAAS